MNVSPIAAASDRDGNGPVIRVKERAKRWAHAAAEPLVRGLLRLGVKPDHVTILGCFLSLVAALAFFEGEFQWGAALMAFSGTVDLRRVPRFDARPIQ